LTNPHTYRTLKSCSVSLLKEKGSKFYGYAFRVIDEEEVKEKLEEIRVKHNDARHHCYAYRLGIGSEERYRVNDDGEPSNSAGKPIYGQLLSAEITNVLIIVVRYFGGVKLGVGGLIFAYKTSAKETLNSGIIIKKEELNYYKINFEYPQMSEVMNCIKSNRLEVINQVFEIHCKIEFCNSIKKSKSLLLQLEEIENVEVEFLFKK
jgi:uncharacterized YigZ family protein